MAKTLSDTPYVVKINENLNILTYETSIAKAVEDVVSQVKAIEFERVKLKDILDGK